MSWRRANSLVHVLSKMSAAWRDDLSSDGELLARFAATRDEDSFRTLVIRHGARVWSVCLGVLREPHDAEEAFQATFLALARQADRLTGHPRIGAWLQTVAKHTARKVLRTNTRQGRLRQRVAELFRPEAEPVQATPAWRAVEAELEGLPPRLRLALTSYYLEGRTHAQTAERLGCSTAEAHRRVEQGQALLRQRLAGRGELAAAGAALAALAAGSAQAVPAGLLAATVSSAVKSAGDTLAAGGAAAATAGLWSGGRRLASVVLLAAAVTGGGVALTGALDRPAPAPRAAVPEAVRSAGPADDDRELAPTARLDGRVTDAGGFPVAGAVVTVLAPPLQQPGGGGARAGDRLAGGTTDATGRFALEVPVDFPRAGGRRVVHLYVRSPGGAVRTQAVTLWPAADDVTVRLPAPTDVCGRVLDPEGRPAGGVRVCVVRYGVVSLPEDGVGAGAMTGWPAAVRTDDAGEFCLPAAGGDQPLTLHCRDDHGRWAAQRVVFDPSDPAGDGFVVRMPASRAVAGRVVAAATGEPVAGCRVHVRVVQAPTARWPDSSLPVETTTDAAGRYECRVQPGHKLAVSVYPPAGVALPAMRRSVLLAAGEGRCEADVALAPGTVVEGTVADDADGRPLANLSVEYLPTSEAMLTPVPAADDTLAPAAVAIPVDAAGRFRAVVPAAPGGLYVREAYVGDAGRAGGRWYAAASKQLVGLAPESPRPVPVALTLRRLASLGGDVVRADGTPAGDAALACRAAVAPGHAAQCVVYPVRAGRFAVNNAESSKWHRLLVVDAGRAEGAVATVAPESANRATVRLQACGSARVRVLDLWGRPAAGYRPELFVFHPDDVAGDEFLETSFAATAGLLGVPAEDLDPAHYGGKLVVGADGWLTLPALIPGAVYSLRTRPEPAPRRGRAIDLREPAVRSRPLMPTLVVKPGEAVSPQEVVLPATGPDADEPR